ncbi:triose-phosphate isomerase [gamma proteobacterium HTCC5015]|nr:triose-phosphate isomerase [gamma proteobacterium HTCC5015]
MYLPQMLDVLQGTQVLVGSQDASEHGSGAFTGEIAASMLDELGVNYVIVGHSERRSLFAESDQRVAAKFTAVAQAQLTPILCVGETEEEREAGQTEAVVQRQLSAVFDVADKGLWQNAVIAYEPVWAIGTGRTATPEMAQAVHKTIRDMLTEALGEDSAQQVRLLYGGSVKPDNAKALFEQNDIDGGLVGGASLKAEDFMAIVAAAEE